MFKLLAACVSVALLWVILAKWDSLNFVSQGRQNSWRHEVGEARLWGQKGDLYRASLHYARAAGSAAAENDWEGLLSVACELQGLGHLQGSGFDAYTLLVRAMLAAEQKQSPEGLRAVADAFRTVGESYASLALSRIRDDWPGAAEKGILGFKETYRSCHKQD